jgi:hypothetical protein
MKWCAGVAVRAVQGLQVFTTACCTLVSYNTYVVLVLDLFRMYKTAWNGYLNFDPSHIRFPSLS